MGGTAPSLFDRPTGVAVAADGSVFVSDGHWRNRSDSARVVKYSANGTFIKTWARLGEAPGEFREPRDIAIGGSRGYVYVADNLYVGATYQDAALGSVTGRSNEPNDRAIVIGDALTGTLKYLIPDPGDLRTMTDTGSSASAIAVDRAGNIYAADVGFNNLRKYVKAR